VAVAFDAVGPSSAGAGATTGTTLTWTHTAVGSGVALVIAVGVGCSTSDAGFSISGVTVDGVAATSLSSIVHANNQTLSASCSCGARPA
jgi:hypothetical protein